MSEHKEPNYKKIYVTLVILLVISVAGPFVGIKWITLLTAFGIALVKANMVIQNFMHLKWERRIVKLALGSSVLLMVLFWAAVAPDVMKHSGRNWQNDAAMAATARGIAPPHGEGEAESDVEPAEAAEPPEGAAEAPEPREDAAAAAPAGFDAEGTYRSVCANCHGMGGAGDGPAAVALTPRPANFADPAFWSGKTDAELLRAIREGGAAVGRSPSMPAWGAAYGAEQTEALLTYVKSLRRS